MMGNLINEDDLRSFLKYKNIDIKLFESLESTNKTAKEMAESGANEGLLIVAEHQSNGRGRLGRSFYSPQGTGLYFTLVLRPDFSADDCCLITPAAAVAVSKAVKNVLGLETQIKWVNDIFYSGKKVCGILCESKLSANENKMDYVVLGIGINLYTPKNEFPDEIKNIAGALTNKIEVDFASKLLAEIINEFLFLYENITDVSFLTEYNQRLMLKGKEVDYLEKGIKKTGKIIDTDERFRLRIETADGGIKKLSSGEITIGSHKAIK